MGSAVAEGAGSWLCLGVSVRVRPRSLSRLLTREEVRPSSLSRCVRGGGDPSSLSRCVRGGGGPSGGGGLGRVLYLSGLPAADSAVDCCH